MSKLWPAVLCLVAAVAVSSGAEPRRAAAEYPAHASLAGLEIGSEFLVRSFSGEGLMFVLENYLVVEVALYPPKGTRIIVNTGNFTLRINGKKDIRLAQTPGIVAASLKYPGWDQPMTAEARAGVGDTGVIVGRREPVERFPGDQRPRRSRLPEPPRAPTQENPSGVEREPRLAAHEVVVRNALADGETGSPVCGYLYFAHRGSTKKIRTVELLYEGVAGSAVLRVR